MEKQTFIIKTKSKRFLLAAAVFLGLLGTFLLGAKNTESMEEIQKGIAGEVLRFHVRANSDSGEDQRIKMEVKKQVVDYLSPILQKADSAEETKILVKKALPKVKAIAQEVLEREGFGYGARVHLGNSLFPEKTYGDMRFPAGEYEALIVYLGDGAGENWWCMLYPGLCFFDETYAVVDGEKKEELEHVLTEQEFNWITDKEQIRIGFKWF